MCRRAKNFWEQKWPNEKCRENLQRKGDPCHGEAADHSRKGATVLSSREANAQQASTLGCRPLSLPDGRHGFTFLPHAPALASDALRPHRRQQQQQVPRQLLLCSGTRRPGARPHTPRPPAAPAETAPRADWLRREGAGTPPTAGGRRWAPGASGRGEPPACLVSAPWRAG